MRLNMYTIPAYFNSVRKFSSYNFLSDEGKKDIPKEFKEWFSLLITHMWAVNESSCLSLGEKLSQNSTSY